MQLLAASAAHLDAELGAILLVGKGQILIGCGQGALNLQALRLNRGKGTVLGPREARNGFPQLFRPGARFDPNGDSPASG